MINHTARIISRTDAAIIPGAHEGFDTERSSIDTVKRESFTSELKNVRVQYRWNCFPTDAETASSVIRPICSDAASPTLRIPFFTCADIFGIVSVMMSLHCA